MSPCLDGYLTGLLPLGHDQQVIFLRALRERPFELAQSLGEALGQD